MNKQTGQPTAVYYRNAPDELGENQALEALERHRLVPFNVDPNLPVRA